MENETALDLEDADAGPVPPVDFRQRRGSQQATRPRAMSAVSTRPAVRSPSASPRKETTALPRMRLNSILTRGIEGASSVPSPLAQMYQPLFFGPSAEGEADHGEGGADAGGAGYGPRRRLSSMQSMHRANVGHLSNPAGNGMRRFPAVSESPDEQAAGPVPGRGRSGGPPETASEVEEGGMNTGTLQKRFDRLEERQKRIEEMLTHLTSSLRR